MGECNIIYTIDLASDILQYGWDGDDFIFCLVEKIMVLLLSWILTSFVSGFGILPQPSVPPHWLPRPAFSHSPLIQHCHPACSFINELNKSMTRAYLSIYMKIRFLIFRELYSNTSITEKTQGFISSSDSWLNTVITLCFNQGLCYRQQKPTWIIVKKKGFSESL